MKPSEKELKMLFDELDRLAEKARRKEVDAELISRIYQRRLARRRR